MIFSPNKHFLSFSNKQKLDNKIKRFSDLPTLIFFGLLAETRVIFFRPKYNTEPALPENYSS